MLNTFRPVSEHFNLSATVKNPAKISVQSAPGLHLLPRSNAAGQTPLIQKQTSYYDRGISEQAHIVSSDPCLVLKTGAIAGQLRISTPGFYHWSSIYRSYTSVASHCKTHLSNLAVYFVAKRWAYNDNMELCVPTRTEAQSVTINWYSLS